MKLLVVTVLLLTLASAQDKNEQPLPELKPRPAEATLPVGDVEVHILKGKASFFTEQRMQALYLAACRTVAQKVHPDWSLNRQSDWLRPKIRLTIGTKNSVFTAMEQPDGELFIMDLQEWNEPAFVAGVVVAATDTVLSQQNKKLAISEVLMELKADPRYTVTPQQLREKH